MATPMSASTFLAKLRAAGLKVVEVGNWKDHNRNHMGAWGPVNGVMIHHTVTSGTSRTVDIVRQGYSGLPGPLCHGMIAKDGTVYLIGWGRANHAGLGDDDVLRAVIAENALPADNEANTDGNRHFYGFECENLGDGEDPWPAAQLLAIEKVAAVLCAHHGWGERSVIGHLEWQPGKVDPRGFTMASMRARIKARLEGGGTDTPAPALYKVRAGDTLTSIARALGVSVDALYAVNRAVLPDKNTLRVGQELTVPTGGELPAPTRPRVSLSRLRAAAESNPDMPGTPVTYAGVKTYEAALVDAGLLAKPYADGHFGTVTVTANSKWQQSLGLKGTKPGQAADGIPGEFSARELGRRYGFDLTT